MSSIHPNWDTTDETEHEVPVRIRAPEPAMALPRKTVNRSPAAIIGILAIAGAGALFFNLGDVLTGQTTDNPLIIRITDAGADPHDIDVSAGDTIRWTNESGIPQILVSDTLLDEEGETLDSSAIFPGSDFTFTIPGNMPAGEYAYLSQTSPSVEGIIRVDMTETTSSAPVTQMSSSSRVTAPAVTASSVSSMQPQPSSTVGGIPVNPYAIANTAFTNVSAGSSAVGKAVTVTDHRPVAQPSSGMGVWLAAIAGVVSLVYVLRKSSV